MRLPGGSVLGEDVARRIEEDDAVGERIEDQPGGDGEHDAGKADQGQPPLLPRHPAALCAAHSSTPAARASASTTRQPVGIAGERRRAPWRAPRARRPAGRGPYRSGPAAPNRRRRRARLRAARRASRPCPRSSPGAPPATCPPAASTSAAVGPGRRSAGAAAFQLRQRACAPTSTQGASRRRLVEQRPPGGDRLVLPALLASASAR